MATAICFGARRPKKVCVLRDGHAQDHLETGIGPFGPVVEAYRQVPLQLSPEERHFGRKQQLLLGGQRFSRLVLGWDAETFYLAGIMPASATKKAELMVVQMGGDSLFHDPPSPFTVDQQGPLWCADRNTHQLVDMRPDGHDPIEVPQSLSYVTVCKNNAANRLVPLRPVITPSESRCFPPPPFETGLDPAFRYPIFWPILLCRALDGDRILLYDSARNWLIFNRVSGQVLAYLRPRLSDPFLPETSAEPHYGTKPHPSNVAVGLGFVDGRVSTVATFDSDYVVTVMDADTLQPMMTTVLDQAEICLGGRVGGLGVLPNGNLALLFVCDRPRDRAQSRLAIYRPEGVDQLTHVHSMCTHSQGLNSLASDQNGQLWALAQAQHADTNTFGCNRKTMGVVRIVVPEE